MIVVCCLAGLTKAYFHVVSIYDSAPPPIVHIIGINQKLYRVVLKLVNQILAESSSINHDDHTITAPFFIRC